MRDGASPHPREERIGRNAVRKVAFLPGHFPIAVGPRREAQPEFLQCTAYHGALTRRENRDMWPRTTRKTTSALWPAHMPASSASKPSDKMTSISLSAILHRIRVLGPKGIDERLIVHKFQRECFSIVEVLVVESGCDGAVEELLPARIGHRTDSFAERVT